MTKLASKPCILIVCSLISVLAACSRAQVDTGAVVTEVVIPHYQQRFPAKITVLPVTHVAPSVNDLVGAMNGAPLITNYTFQLALIDALAASGLFAGVTRGADAHYALLADVVEQRQEGYSVTVEVRYTLTDIRTGAILWSDDISTSDYYPSRPIAFVSPAETKSDALWLAFRLNMERMISEIAKVPASPQP